MFDTEISESLSLNNNNHNVLLPIDYFGKNYSLRFELHPSRKSMVIPLGNDKVSYLELIDYLKKKNKALDFKKMKHRGIFNLIYTQQLNTTGVN